MTGLTLDNRAGGVALVVGYSLLIVVLFRNPVDGFVTATETGQGLLFFVVFPLLGLGSGIYAILGMPYCTSLTFLGGSYLGLVGIALTMLQTATLVTAAFGLFLLGVGVLALVATLRSTLAGGVGS